MSSKNLKQRSLQACCSHMKVPALERENTGCQVSHQFSCAVDRNYKHPLHPMFPSPDGVSSDSFLEETCRCWAPCAWGLSAVQ